MKNLQRLMNERSAKTAARFMTAICYLLMLVFTAGLVLSLIGRQTFILHTSTGTYDSAIYSEADHNWTSRGPTVSMKDQVRVLAYDNDDNVDLITQVGLSAMYTVNVIPLIVCFWFLSRVFDNINKGFIFTDKNAVYLLYYGLIQIAVAAVVPFIKMLIVFLANQFTRSQIHIQTGQNLISDLVPNIAFIVAAYIIHYGVHLQDEADHTL